MELISFDRNGGREASLPQLPRVLSFVGGGGKSTLMYCLAETLAGRGKKVLVTTSTHIYVPKREFYAADAQAVHALWARKQFAVLGTEDAGKLTQPDRTLWAQVMPQADVALVEADGSKGFPVKVPRDKEPVIWPETDLVVCVMGLSAIGQPWKTCCFGEGRHYAGVFTEEAGADLLCSETGGRKGVGSCGFWVVLNQCDDEERRAAARRMAQLLKGRGVDAVFASSFDARERAYYSGLANAGAFL